MKTTKILSVTIILLTTLINITCKNQNHIDKYEVDLDSLKLLPNNFYAFRHGRIYFEDIKLEKYRIWFNLDNYGNIENIFKVENFKDLKIDDLTTIRTYQIDTIQSKKVVHKFIELSREFKFWHINIDKENKIAFSYKDGLLEQYVKTLNDSLKITYLKNANFKLLNNGWFKYNE